MTCHSDAEVKVLKKLLMTMVAAPGRPAGGRVVVIDHHKGLVGVPR
jgi:hypothetical protein